MTPGRTLRRRRRPASPVHQRFAERAGRLRRRPHRLVLWAVAVLVLVTGVAALLLWSPAFVVEDIVVEGVKGPIAESVEADASIPAGLPLARVDTAAATARIEQDVRVAEASVTRDWPSALTVQVRLREPAVAIAHAGSPTYQLADAGGVVFETVPSRPDDVPLVQVAGDRTPEEGLAGALALLRSLRSDVRADLGAVRLEPSGDLSFEWGSVTVHWGDGNNAGLKSEVLGALLRQEQIDTGGEQPITIDLSTPKTPVVTGLTPVEEE